MAIMKLTDVPELTEFAGTEKIYVNDNGETKQIACDKVVTAGGGSGGGVFIIDSTADDYVEGDDSSAGKTYGTPIVQAFLDGKFLYYYNGTSYMVPVAVRILEYDDGCAYIDLWTLTDQGGSGIATYMQRHHFYSNISYGDL